MVKISDDQIDPKLEPAARRIASDMGDPVLTDADWDIFFGRLYGILAPEVSLKMICAYAAARSLAREGL